jgi:hypothetical protein
VSRFSGVFGNLKGESLGEFAAVCENILGYDRWQRGCSKKKVGKLCETIRINPYDPCFDYQACGYRFFYMLLCGLAQETAMVVLAF